ncbi:hypothetical protein [Actinoplanes sp. NPDC049599]|uniref:hypothetical protein n=1 Tax=Actinoplanes sp. NPDC049599 TaxID=3363903 RepID=UPI003790A447
MIAPTAELHEAFGRPHVTPLPAIWDAGRLHGGLDVVVEGVAVRVTEQARLGELAALWKSKLDWDFGVGDDAFRDADGRTGLVYAIRPDKVLSFGKGPYTQNRYRFA